MERLLSVGIYNMKTRLGFVSNSSSSSFVINLDNLSAKQLRKIIHNPTTDPQHEEYGSWNIEVTEHEVKGSTYMDNYDFCKYLTEDCLIDPSDITFDN